MIPRMFAHRKKVMRVMFTAMFTAAFTVQTSALAEETTTSPVRRGPKLLDPVSLGIGSQVADLAFQDLKGEPHRLSDMADAKATVIAMTSTSCPLSKKYLATLIELARAYATHDVRFVLANPVVADDETKMQEAQAAFGASAVYVFDRSQTLARGVSARTTTDVVVLDAQRRVVYQGAVDDQYGLGYAHDEPRSRFLADALDSILVGKSPEVTATAAPGCTLTIDRGDAPSESVTYFDHVAPLVQKHCMECHRDGGVAPFALESIDDVRAHAAMIHDVVERGVMPPWFAKKDNDESVSPWANDRSLTQSDKSTLLNWIEGDQVAGDPLNAPTPTEFHDGWLIGKPDAVFTFPEPVQVKATGTMPYQYVTVETDLDEDKWVQAIEVRPGDRSVVHHVLVFVQGPSKRNSPRGERDDEEAGYWGIYVPGNSTLVYPEGFAKRLPRGARLRFQMHYTPNGKATEDVTQLGLIYSKTPPQHEIRVAGIVNAKLEIPPGANNHQEFASIRVPEDVRILAFLPHMHLRGKAARFDWINNAGTRTLLDIPHYDFNWQLIYRYAEPLEVRRGDQLRFTAWYDNSADNPANPDPTKTVRWGEQTFDEMHLGYVEYITDEVIQHESAETIAAEDVEKLIREGTLFSRLDLNGDGELTKEEVRQKMNQPKALETFDRLDVDGNGRVTQKEFQRLISRYRND